MFRLALLFLNRLARSLFSKSIAHSPAHVVHYLALAIILSKCRAFCNRFMGLAVITTTPEWRLSPAQSYSDGICQTMKKYSLTVELVCANMA